MLLDYCKRIDAEQLPAKFSRSNINLLDRIPPRPPFKNPRLTQMFENLIRITREVNRVHELGILCQTVPLFLEANRKMLRCHNSILELKDSVLRTGFVVPQKKTALINECQQRCKGFEGDLNAAIEGPGLTVTQIAKNLEDLSHIYHILPLSLALSLRRIEGGDKTKNSSNNLMGITPDGQNHIFFNSPMAAAQSSVDAFACTRQTRCKFKAPGKLTYQKLYDQRKSYAESLERKPGRKCPYSINGDTAAKGIKCYNSVNANYTQKVRNLRLQFKYDALDAIWRDFENNTCMNAQDSQSTTVRQHKRHTGFGG